MRGYLKVRVKAFGYAFKGIACLFRNEAHAKIHLCAAFMVVLAGFAFSISPLEWCAVALCIGGVFMGEAFNSAIEALADKVSPEFDPVVGKAKDLAAGAVLLFVFCAIAVGLIIYLPKLIALF